jgi:hypothetical protein
LSQLPTAGDPQKKAKTNPSAAQPLRPQRSPAAGIVTNEEKFVSDRKGTELVDTDC